VTSEDFIDAYVATCVVVPAYNEGRSIANVVRSIEEHMPGSTVTVVNDGSSDDTALRAREADATVLSLPINLGIGGAVQTGFKYALENGFQFVIQIDGDGQHDPMQSHHLLKELLADNADIVIGSRWLGRGEYVAPRNRRYGMKFLETLVSWKAGSRFTDTTSGFRALNRRALTLFSEHYPTDYPEVESIILAHHHGLRVKEVPVSMKPREHGYSSIRGLRTMYFMVRITMVVMLGVVGGENA
jgi:glycosyltransferase involved in cell wall biosynthesis